MAEIATQERPPATAKRELRKKLWKVDLGKMGPVTPSVFFAKEHPNDPRGKPIEAANEEEAWEIFRKLHGIIACEHAAEFTEMTPEEAEIEVKPAKKTKKMRRG